MIDLVFQAYFQMACCNKKVVSMVDKLIAIVWQQLIQSDHHPHKIRVPLLDQVWVASSLKIKKCVYPERKD